MTVTQLESVYFIPINEVEDIICLSKEGVYGRIYLCERCYKVTRKSFMTRGKRKQKVSRSNKSSFSEVDIVSHPCVCTYIKNIAVYVNMIQLQPHCYASGFFPSSVFVSCKKCRLKFISLNDLKLYCMCCTGENIYLQLCVRKETLKD